MQSIFMDIMPSLHFTGLVLAVGTFLIIGLFHPIVIKIEYHFGTRLWWVFLLAGIGAIVGAFFIENVLAASLLGVTGFSCLWSILELFEQRQRVRKGWFPKGPGHQS